ncbi:Lipin/Ned1/Smp2-domain-containing protein [Coniella lustricola]|uniref:Lipin/Ned1/Smp2-domain-containing protein n=1 Tax=Coniella lustricola TaxID=2025994 RepID=A0A2T2ZYU4_9PEZI|nr:Lipin/Ned1/Smp2-domain-containing protein [Coniella lustricola]
MQYVRNISDSVSTAWNSINPATLSGAIDVIVVEQADGTLSCSPFHVRFGKFSLLRPYEKKVEFRVNGRKQDYAMKLGEGGEAFFVFETSDTIPQNLQTSPLVSPASSPPLAPGRAATTSVLQDPPLLELDYDSHDNSSTVHHAKARAVSPVRPLPSALYSSSMPRDAGLITPASTSTSFSHTRPKSGDFSHIARPHSEDVLHQAARKMHSDTDLRETAESLAISDDRSISPPPIGPEEALERARNLSRGLQAVNIPTRVTDKGDLMLDMTGFKDSEEDAIRAEVLARKVLSEELEGNYDIGALFGIDEHGNLWIYSSEEAKDAAMRRTMESGLRSNTFDADAVSDPGYNSDDSTGTANILPVHRRTESDVGQSGLQTPPASPGSGGGSGTRVKAAGDPNRNYAKTLRLTSDQLKALELKAGENSLSFTVNKATCSAFMYLWKYDTPVVISDIDGTITKSDALGHLFHRIGRDWTHAGVAKLYSDIVANGYNIMYLTSRSVGQADTTRDYLAGIVQDNYRLPRGPTILSPDRTMAALRREIYLRKPQVFKMATLRDIRQLYSPAETHPFYAGFGNRLTDQISYRTVDVPRTRIFTINSNAEVSLDLLSLNKLKLSYVSMTDVVDHYFPPVSTIVKGGGEDYTDFAYWRDKPLELDEFSASDDDEDGFALEEEEEDDDVDDDEDEEDEEDDDDETAGDGLGDSYISRGSYEEEGYVEGSVLSGDLDEEEQERLTRSMMETLAIQGDADDEEEEDDDEEVPEVEATKRVHAETDTTAPAVATDGNDDEPFKAPLAQEQPEESSSPAQTTPTNNDTNETTNNSDNTLSPPLPSPSPLPLATSPLLQPQPISTPLAVPGGGSSSSSSNHSKKASQSSIEKEGEEANQPQQPISRSHSPRIAVQDRSAELITGMKDLTIEKEG